MGTRSKGGYKSLGNELWSKAERKIQAKQWERHKVLVLEPPRRKWRRRHK